jgi:flagellar hook-associated protein 3 FlgL
MDGILSSGAFLTASLARQGAGLRAELQRASTELTTGQKADAGAAVRGDFYGLSAIDHSLARLRGYKATTSETALLAETMQTALGVISDGAATLGADLLRNTGLEVAGQLGAIAGEGRRHFDTAIAALNTRFAERAVFGGVVAESAPLPDAETLLAALDTATAGAITVQDVVTAISDWFDDPAGYGGLYAGGAARSPLPVATGDEVTLDATAMDPAIRDTLKGLAMVAMLDRGILAGQDQARADLARAAGEQLLTSGEARATLMARIGTAQAQIENATSRTAAEETALGIARANMLAADPYETATQLQDIQTRLESLYLLTARLSGLSLTEYLR